jgi:hypothetical protein
MDVVTLVEQHLSSARGVEKLKAGKIEFSDLNCISLEF